MKIRIQKYLSEKGLFSRRRVEEFIRTKRLKINGQLALLGDKMDEGDSLLLDGAPLPINSDIKKVLIAFYKPVGMETTLKKEKDVSTIADVDFGVGRVFPIGRLDKDSQGLLLLTNDGDLANKMAHPRYGKEKEYIVSVNKKIDQNFCSKIESGILILGKKTEKCSCKIIRESVFSLTIKEGKNRQIRRMCGSLGYEVLDLLRIRVGDFNLEDLKPGEYRRIK